MKEKHVQKWRTLLGEMLKQPGERQRLIKNLGVNSLTLTRWVGGQSVPRPFHQRQVLTLISQYFILPLTALTEDIPDFFLDSQANDESPSSIASEFYAEVLQVLANVPTEQSRWSSRNRILTYIFEQLNPQQDNLTITLLQCVPPSTGGKVRSLQVLMGQGRSPWGGDLEQQAVFYGVDSVAGRVASSGRMLMHQNLVEETSKESVSSKEGMGSLCVYPLLQGSRIAGTFNILSSQPNFFTSSRTSLLKEYSYLLAITFPQENFYAFSDIELCLIPPVPQQIPYLTSFRGRVIQAMKQAAGSQHVLTSTQAEMLTWQRIEDELIQRASSMV